LDFVGPGTQGVAPGFHGVPLWGGNCSANGAAQPQPRATPWVFKPQPHPSPERAALSSPTKPNAKWVPTVWVALSGLLDFVGPGTQGVAPGFHGVPLWGGNCSANGAAQPQPRAPPWVFKPKPQPSPERAAYPMPQSLARLYIHLIFSTKHREHLITDAVRNSLHAYMATVLQNLGCDPVLINSVEDHVHILFELSRTVSVSQAVEEVKKSSSKWIKTQGNEFINFAWQAGYGAFTVSESNTSSVRQYITNQQEHHRKKTFQEEYRLFLEKHGLVFDERYVWD
jgi:REP element-mobilizing transposase RayT